MFVLVWVYRGYMSTEQSYWQRTAAGVRAELGRQRRDVKDLATVLNRSRNYVSLKVNGHKPFDLDEIEAIAAWLEVPVASFSEKASV